MSKRGRQQRQGDGDVVVRLVPGEVGAGQQRREKDFHRLAGELGDGWEGRARTLMCRVTCERISQMVRQELKLNNDVLLHMVDFLLALRPSSVQGGRLPAAVMQSHMGATVDRQIYQPRLRELLKPPVAHMSVLVPVTSAECSVVSDVLALIGSSLWKEYHLALRRQQEQRSRRERSGEVDLPKVPASASSLRTICAIAAQWRALDPSCLQPVQVMILLEDFASVDRSVLRSLFRALAEAQFGEPWCRGIVAFSVVLWASAEVDLRAELLDHLYLVEKPFLPATTMLGNVLFALLVEPQLPCVLPADVYSWLLDHFTNESHSLAWLLHVLHALVFDYFSRGPGSWTIHSLQDGSVPPGLVDELQRLLPPLARLPKDQVRDTWLASLDKWNEYRLEVSQAFVELWRVTRILLPNELSILESYGKYLQCGSCEVYGQKLRTALTEHLVLQSEGQQIHLASQIETELSLLKQGRPDAPHLERALNILGAALHHNGRAAKSEGEGLSATASTAPPPPPPPLVVAPVLKPKDLLLSRTSDGARHHGSSGGGSGGGGAPGTSAGSSVNIGNGSTGVRRGGKGTVNLMVEMLPVGRSLLECLDALLQPLHPPADEVVAALAKLARYQGSKETMQARLLGNSREEVLRQLQEPNLDCLCCKQGGLKRSRSSFLGSSTAGLEASQGNTGSCAIDTQEDVCIVYQVALKNHSKGEVHVDEWQRLFFERIGQSDADAVARFKRAVGDLQGLGLVHVRNRKIAVSID